MRARVAAVCGGVAIGVLVPTAAMAGTAGAATVRPVPIRSG